MLPARIAAFILLALALPALADSLMLQEASPRIEIKIPAGWQSATAEQLAAAGNGVGPSATAKALLRHSGPDQKTSAIVVVALQQGSKRLDLQSMAEDMRQHLLGLIAAAKAQPEGMRSGTVLYDPAQDAITEESTFIRNGTPYHTRAAFFRVEPSVWSFQLTTPEAELETNSRVLDSLVQEVRAILPPPAPVASGGLDSQAVKDNAVFGETWLCWTVGACVIVVPILLLISRSGKRKLANRPPSP